MRFRRRLAYESGLKQFALTPFLNIFFLLVTLLLLVCGFIDRPGIAVNLPRLITSQLIKKENLQITVTAEGLFLMDGVARTFSQVKQFFSALPARRVSVLVQFEKRAPADAVLQLWELCQEAGITDLSVARISE